MAKRTEDFVRLFAVNPRRIHGLVAAIVPNAADADALCMVGQLGWVPTARPETKGVSLERIQEELASA